MPAAKLCLFTSMVVGLRVPDRILHRRGTRGNPIEQEYWWNRVFGQWWWAAWIMLLCNMVLPLSLFSQKLRRNTIWLWILSLFINLGMWFERFVIFVPSLSHEFEPWQWHVLHADVGGHRDPVRELRLVLHVVPAVHPADCR